MAVACACCFDFRCRKLGPEVVGESGHRRAEEACVPFGRRWQRYCGVFRDSLVTLQRWRGDAADHFLQWDRIYPRCGIAVGSAAAAAEVVVTAVAELAAVDGEVACGQLCPSWTAAAVAGDRICVLGSSC